MPRTAPHSKNYRRDLPNHYVHDCLGNPYTCTGEHNHPLPIWRFYFASRDSLDFYGHLLILVISLALLVANTVQGRAGWLNTLTISLLAIATMSSASYMFDWLRSYVIDRRESHRP